MDKKYTSLEHSIRNIMTESIGAIGTDKFTKTGNSFFRSFHVEPKKGDTHPNGNAIRATRNSQNERGSSTMNSVTEEEQLDEYFKYTTPPISPKIRPGEAPTVPTPKVEPLEPDVKEPNVTPTPVTPPAESPKPKTPGVETPEAPKKTPGAGEPTTKPSGQIKTDGGNAPSAKEESGVKPKGQNAPNTKTTDAPTPKKTKKPEFPIISFPLAVNPLLGAFGGTNVRTFMHSPQEYMESTEANKIRQSIENVARPGGKNRITKQAELKAKIIEDNNRKANIVRAAIKEKKAGQNPLVDTKPKLKNLELDEGRRLNSLGKAAGVVGAGGAVGATGVLGSVRDKLDTPDRTEKKDWFGVPNQQYGGVDAVADFASMWPGLGIPASLYSAYRSAQRGDTTDMYLDLASAIPGVGTIIKGYKNVQHLPRLARFATKLGDPSTWKAAKVWGSTTPARAKVGGAIENVGSRATQAITGAEFGDLGHELYKSSKEYKDIMDKSKQSGEWNTWEPESQKEYEKMSTMTGQLKNIGSEYGSQLNKDVLQPAKETLKNLSLVSPAGAATPEKTSLPKRGESGKGDLPMPLDVLQKKKPKGPSIEVFGGPTSSAPGKSYGKTYLNQK